MLNAARQEWFNGTSQTASAAINQTAAHVFGVALREPDGFFFSDTVSLTVRQVAAGVGTVIAGTPFVAGRRDGTRARFTTPGAIAYEMRRRRVFVVDEDACAIRVINASGFTSTVFGGGTNQCGDVADNTAITSPLAIGDVRGIAVSDALGVLLWSEAGPGRIVQAPLTLTGASVC